MKKRIVSVLLVALMMTGCTFSAKQETQKKEKQNLEEQYEVASTTPFGKYPEEVTYTLGKMAGTNNSNLPSGDTYEDNVYTRYLNDMLNIQNIDVFEEDSVTYYDIVEMAIAEKNLPDVMLVQGLDNLQTLVENDMIEDLTEAYENCASERIKDIYGSYDESVLGNVTFDGKLMALPETKISDGPQMLWLRKDWMDKLGLSEPKTLEDAEYIIEQFVTQNPGEVEEGNIIGLACENEICGEMGYNYEYHLEILFAAYDSYPQQWMKDEEGNLYYGGVQPQTKEALAKAKEWYERGIIDKQFLMRTNNNIAETIIEGKCGAFFGPWWAPNNPLMEAIQENPEAEWKPYLLTNTEDGKTRYAEQNASTQYVVVRKGYEHPEVIMKMVSVLFDYVRYTDINNEDFIHYYQWNVDPTARPISINVDYRDALNRCYNNLTSALNGERQVDSMELLEQSYYQHCAKYEEDPENATPDEWAAYTSRITACEILKEAEDNIEEIKTYYFAETDTMRSIWWKLKEMQKQAYLEIITGQKPLDYFDTFVEQWYEIGGRQIVEEVNESYKER